MSKRVVIIGNGIAGVTAARFIRKLSSHQITIISDETDHFFSRTALMYIFMGHMRFQDTKPYEDHFWARNRIDLLRKYVVKLDVTRKSLHFREGGELRYDILVLATGSHSNKFGWPGEDLEGVQGLYGVPDLQEMERTTSQVSHAVVIGGGLIGIEMAEMLHARHISTSFLVRESNYMDYLLPYEEATLINDEIRRQGIDLRLNTELDAIIPDAGGRVSSIKTKDGTEIECQFVGLTVGVHPNIDLARGSDVETNRGVLVNQYFETNIPDVYAVGDCVEFREDDVGHRRIEQLWYSGRKHGKTVALTICGHRKPYERGVFFNSAKFFTVEYQTYGRIDPIPPVGVRSLFWEDRDKKKLVRINYLENNGAVLGFNVLGVRLRQALCERWILEQRNIAYVLQHLKNATFDPEFYPRFEHHLVDRYKKNHPDSSIELVSKRSFFSRLLG